MDHKTEKALHTLSCQIRYLAVAAAHSQLDMAALKLTRYGRQNTKAEDWPLVRLDELATQLAEPGLAALQKLTTALGVGE